MRFPAKVWLSLRGESDAAQAPCSELEKEVQPPIVERQIEFAESVAEGHREAASLCSQGQEALQARFLQGAQTIDVLVALLKSATWVAKLNHDTIKNRSVHERADAF